MHANESSSAQSGARNDPRSAAAAAQLLELWVYGRVLLERSTVDKCLLLLFELDRAAGDKYHDVY